MIPTVVLFMFGGFIAATGVASFAKSAWLTAFGIRGTGSVVAYVNRDPSSSRRIPVLYPIIEFSHRGKTERFTEEKGQANRVGRLMGAVPVCFAGSDPAYASVSTYDYLWHDSLMRLLVSCVFLAIAFWLHRSSRNKEVLS